MLEANAENTKSTDWNTGSAKAGTQNQQRL